MARYLAIANLIYLTLAIQPILSSLIPAASFSPWLPTIALMVCVANGKDLSSIACAFVLGLCVDCLSIHRPGVHAIIATSLAVILRLFLNGVESRGVILFGFLTFFAAFAWLTSSTVMHGLLEEQAVDAAQAAESAAAIATVTTVLVVAFLGLNATFQFLLRARDRSPVVLANRWTMLTGK